MTMIGDLIALILIGLGVAWTLLNVGAMVVAIIASVILWLRDPDWQAAMRFGLGWACIAGAVLAYQALAHGAADEVAAWVVLISLGVAALGWYKHDRARMALWRTGRDEGGPDQ